MSVEILAKFSRSIYKAEFGNFAVFEFIDTTTARRFKAKGPIHDSPKSDVKQIYRLIGNWENQPKYGETFNTIYMEALRPQELKGIAPYLANNIKGIGEITAKKFIEHLNVKSIAEIVDVCKNKREDVFNFFGENKKHLAQNIIDMMVLNEVFRSIMIFLHEHQISPNFAKKIYEKYAAKSVEILMENPYRLIADFRQVGFLKADAIAQKLGIEKTSIFRIEAAIIYSLEAAMDDGHCALPTHILIDNVASHLGGKTDPQFSTSFVLDMMRKIYKKNKDEKKESFFIRQLEIQKNNSVQEKILFYLPEVLKMEDEIASYLLMLIKEKDFIHLSETERKIKYDILNGNKKFEECFPDIPWIQLTEEQKQAVILSFDSSIMILTGGPGCGKTFVLKSIFKLQKALNRRVALCAPTGLAAKRMTAAIGVNAFTIHKLLGLGIKKEKDKENTIENINNIYIDERILSKVDTIIIDESSMLNLEIFYTLLKAGGINKRFIFVGDTDQLPSIGAGNCLKDMIASKQIPTVTLTHIFRQTAESPIPIAAREIISGQKPKAFACLHPLHLQKKEDFIFIPCTSEIFFEFLIPFVTKIIPTLYELDPIKECQILVPLRRTPVGQENINKVLQETLNPPSEHKQEFHHPAGYKIRVNDKVIQTKNNYELDVFNGDLGYCRAVRKTSESIEVEVEFSHKVVTYIDEQSEHLQLCYAMTVHKSQGSEFQLCIIPMFGAYYTMLDRNLFYTAVTRSSKHVILFGEEWALKRAVRNQNAYKRFTALDKLLQS